MKSLRIINLTTAQVQVAESCNSLEDETLLVSIQDQLIATVEDLQSELNKLEADVEV